MSNEISNNNLPVEYLTVDEIVSKYGALFTENEVNELRKIDIVKNRKILDTNPLIPMMLINDLKAWFPASTPPNEPGWYICELKNGDKIKVPLAHTMSGSLVWVIPDSSQVVKWREF